MEENYYEILEVNKNASPEIIEKAYKTLVKKYHPDLQEDNLKNIYEEKIKKINEAYDILSNSEKRKNYDLNLNNNFISSDDYNNLINENINLKKEINYLKNNLYDIQKNINNNYNNSNNKINYNNTEHMNNNSYDNYHNAQHMNNNSYNNYNKNQENINNAYAKAYYDAYIAAFTKDEYDRVVNAYENASDDDSIITEGVSYVGMSKSIPEEVRKLAIESYPEIFENDINESEFDEFFGNFYILVNADPIDYTGPIMVSIMLLIFGSYFMYRGIKSKIKTKNVMNSDLYIRSIDEIESPEFETNKAILTKNYLVYAESGLNIIPYTDITWIYPHVFRYNGVPNHSVAYYIKGSKKMHLISYGLKESTVNEVLYFIKDKNKDVLFGYTDENKKLYKEMI